MTGLGRRRLLAATLLAVATAGCGVPTSNARVAGAGPDTSPAALERAAEEAAAQGEQEARDAAREELRSPLTAPALPGDERTDAARELTPPTPRDTVPAEDDAAPAEDEAAGTAETVPVLLREADGLRYVARPTSAPADPAALVAALAAPLTTDELARGLWTEVPVETYLAGIEGRGRRSIVVLGGFDGGGTDAAIWRRSQQVACTLARHLPATDTVEVHVGRELLGVFGEDGDACP